MTSQLINKRIFITEDNSANRVVYTMTLGRAGASLDYDRSGNDTIRRLKDFRPDLIILDLMLPYGDSGYDIFRRIRATPEFDSVPVVAVSAADPSSAMRQCQKLGFAGFIAKPIETDLFVHQLALLLEGQSVWYIGERYGGVST